MKTAIVSVFATMLLASVAAAAQVDPIATEGGLVDGVTLESGVRAWLGVPFAAPPVRELRWRPPQPMPKWRGVLHAERAAPMCLQSIRTRTMNHYFGNEAISEDCLYLNIWSPTGASRLPVIVWIYGGGFNVGSASMANYSGEGLAQKGVVRVNLAYRVGALGFFAHPELTRESGTGASGNYGLMDQVAGLEWVKRNIAAFGGDPDNVTIAGQSAGSTSVALLQMSPAAKGLLHKVVGMSGSPFGEPMSLAPLARAEAEGLALQNALGAKSIEGLRDIGGDRIIAVNVPRSSVVIDGRYVIGPARDTFATNRQSDVPVMMGFTRDESFRPLGDINSVGDYETAVQAHFPANAASVLAAYPATDVASARRAAVDVGRDASLGLRMAQWALAQAQFGKAPVYPYFFTRRQPYAPGITFIDHDPANAGAYHTGEVPYFLRTRESLNLFRQTRNWEPVDARLEDDMSGLLLSFARNGVPVSPRVPQWPRFDARRPRVVSLGEEIRVVDWPNYKTLTLLDSPLPPPRPAAPNRARD